MKLLILTLVLICCGAACESPSQRISEEREQVDIYAVYASDDIFYLQKHPDYHNWVAISSEKFGELVQGCDITTALEFLSHNSYKNVTSRYEYDYSSIESIKNK